MEINLCPSQQFTFDWLTYSLARGNLVTVSGKRGLGKTTLLKFAQQQHGGILLNNKSFLETLSQHNPVAIEEAFFNMLLKAIEEHEVILLDDYHLLRTAFCENHGYQRKGLAGRIANRTLRLCRCLKQENHPVHRR